MSGWEQLYHPHFAVSPPSVSAGHLRYRNRFSLSGATNAALDIEPEMLCGYVHPDRAGTMAGAPQLAVRAEFL